MLFVTEPLKHIEVNSVADLTVTVDVDELFAAKAKVVQQAPGPVVGPDMEPLGA